MLLCVASVIPHPDQFVLLDQQVTIKCHASTSEPVVWEYRNPEMPSVAHIYDRRLLSAYKRRFTVDESTYDLSIRKTELNDTGEYLCYEEEGVGILHITKLFVTGILWL